MSTIYIINRQTDKIIGHLSKRGNKLYKDEKHIQDLITGERTFQFALPAKIKEAGFFDDLIAFVIPKEEGEYAEFVPYKTRTIGRWKNVIGVASYVDIETQKIIPAGTYSGSLRQLALMALDGTDYQVGTIEHVGSRTITIEDSMGPYSFLIKLKTLFNVEMNDRVSTAGPRVTGRFIDLVSRVGRQTRKEIRRGKDLISVEKVVDKERVITALQVEGPRRQDGTRLSVFVSDDEAFQKWNVKGKHRVRIYRPTTENQDITLAELTQLGEIELKRNIDSAYSYIVTSEDISQRLPHEKLWLGDTCQLIDEDSSPPLYADARVVRIERPLTKGAKKIVKIGEVVTYTEDEMLKRFVQMREIYETRILRSPERPPVRNRTIWVQSTNESGGAEVAHIPSNGDWIPITPTNVVELDKNYNGWYFDAEEGLVVYRTDNLVRIVLDSTSGIKIQRRTLVTDPWKDAFGVDSAGNMILVGELFTPSIEKGFGGAWYGDDGWYAYGEGSDSIAYGDNHGMHLTNQTMSDSYVDYVLAGMWHYKGEYIGGPAVRSLLYGSNGIRLFDENSPLPAKEVLSGLLFNERKIEVLGSFETQAIQSLTLLNGWLNFSSTSEPWQRAGFYKDLSGVVHLTGLIKDGTTANGTVLGTLPVGYRPAKQEVFTVTTSSGTARIDVYPNGQIIGARDLNATFTSLSGPSFKAA